MTTGLTNTVPLSSRTSEADVRLEEISPNLWRVLDARLPRDDAAALLGFVTVVAGLFEVTALARPLEMRFCADEQAARLAFLDAAASSSALGPDIAA